MMAMICRFPLLVALLVASAWSASAREPLEVDLAINRDGRYVKVVGSSIRITPPAGTFLVIVTNVTDSSIEMRQQAMAGADAAVRIEMQDSTGQTYVVSRKPQDLTASVTIMNHLPARGCRQIEVGIDPDSWQGLPPDPGFGEFRYKLRVVFVNGGKSYYSRWYDVLIDR